MPQQERRFYHDDDDVLGKILLETPDYTLTALLVTAEDTKDKVELIDTADLTEYEITILINGNLVRYISKAGLIEPWLEAMGSAAYLVLTERANIRDRKNDEGQA